MPEKPFKLPIYPKPTTYPVDLPVYWNKYIKYGNLCVLPAQFSVTAKRYNDNGLQGSSCCIGALTFGHLSNAASWISLDVDGILEFGHLLHRRTLMMREDKCVVFLEPNEIYRFFYIHKFKITVRVVKECTFGIRSDCEPLEDFLKNMRNFLMDKNRVIVSTNHKQYAIWIDGNSTFIFNGYGHEKDASAWTGENMKFGCCTNNCFGPYAVVVRAANAENILKWLFNELQYRDKYCEISLYSFTVEKIVTITTYPPESLVFPPPAAIPPKPDVIPATPVKPPPPAHRDSELTAWEKDEPTDQYHIPIERARLPSDTNFTVMTPNVWGILRSSTHQADPNFSRYYAGTQSLGNAVAALLMLRLYKSKYWTKKIVDDILRLGEKIHHKSKEIPNFGIVDKVDWEDREFTPRVQHYAAMGWLQTDRDDLLDLKSALKDFLHDHDCTILMGPLVLAIWLEDGIYYMFDPNERDGEGKKDMNPWNAPGFACVTWFKELKDLIALYFNNVELANRYDRFFLSKVEIEDYSYISEKWCNFKSFKKNRWILRGGFSQESHRFPIQSRNTQATAIAVNVIINTMFLEECEWTEETVDNLLIEGDEFYRDQVAELQRKGRFKSPKLLVAEISTRFPRGPRLIDLRVIDCYVVGSVHNKENYPNMKNLEQGFEEFFDNFPFCVLVSHNVSMAIWKRNDDYFYFDSHTLDEKGVVSGFGTAACMRFVQIEDMVQQIKSNLEPDGDDTYNLTVVLPSIIPLDEFGKVISPLGNYKRVAMSLSTVILRSKYSESDDRFEKTQGLQSVPIALAAIAYNILTPSFEWCEEDVDQILMEGDDLYKDSLAAFLKSKGGASEEGAGPGKEGLNADADKITVDNVIKEFYEGLNKFTAKINIIAEGTMADNLESALTNFYKNGPNGEVKPENSYIIFQNPLFCIAIWKDDFRYYIYDPKPRDENGEVFGKDEWSELPEPVGEEEGEEFDAIDMGLLAANLGGGDMGGGGGGQGGGEGEKHSEEYWTNTAKEQGKACVVRFDSITDVILHLLENSPPKERGLMRFTIYKVNMITVPFIKELYDPELGPPKDAIAGNWYNFSEVSYGRWILRGTRSLLHPYYPLPNRGRQAIPMCYTAIAYSFLYVLSKYKNSTVDYILNYGDKLYTATLKLIKNAMKKDMHKTGYTLKEIEALVNYRKFYIKDFIRKFCIQNQQVTLNVEYDKIVGDMHADDDMSISSINKGLTTLFNQYRFGVFECRGLNIAVMRINNVYYMFDPNPRGPSGIISPTGVACITRFVEFQDLIRILLYNIPKEGSTYLFIHPIKVSITPPKSTAQEEDEKCVVARPVGGFNPIVEGKWVLRGESDPRPFESHQAGIAFVALTLSLVHKIDCWTRVFVDDILTYGRELSVDSATSLGMNYNPWDNYLDICHVLRDFKIGAMDVSVILRDCDQRGFVDIKQPTKFLNLEKALRNFFLENTHGVLQVEPDNWAVWMEESADDVPYYYLFDAHSRGITGMSHPRGKACVIKLKCLRQMFDHLLEIIQCPDKRSLPFIITPLEIVVGDCRTPQRKKIPDPDHAEETYEAGVPPINFECSLRKEATAAQKLYRKIADRKRKQRRARREAMKGRCDFFQVEEGFEILRGFRKMRAYRDIPTNFACFVMFMMKKPDEWSWRSIETILDCGEQLYMDSIVTYTPEEKVLGLSYVLRRVIWGDRVLQIRVYKPLPCGVFTVENLTETLEKFFNQTNVVLLTYLGRWITLFLSKGYYFYFDPYGRNLEGKTSQGKEAERDVACVIKVKKPDAFIGKIVDNFKKEEEDEFFIVLLDLGECQKM